MNNIPVEERVCLADAEDSVREKDWAGGSTDQLRHHELIITANNKAEMRDIVYAPAWLKIVDEPIVNALDQAITTGQVREIRISLAADGRIRIYNDGPGIPVTIHGGTREKFGRDIWIPTLLFGHLFIGTNYIRPPGSIVGGTNGIGAKLCNIYSTEFIMDTVDTVRGFYFAQRWTDNKRNELPPVIVPLTDPTLTVAKRTPHTTLSFMPDYARTFKCPQPNIAALSDLVRTRATMAAIYAASCGARVFFNDVAIQTRTIGDLARIVCPNTHITQCTVRDWDIAIAIRSNTKDKTPHNTNVNGVVVRSGKHIDHILSLIVSGVRDAVKKQLGDKNIRFSDDLVSRSVIVFANTRIPDVKWAAQRKDVAIIDPARLVDYVLPQSLIDDLAGHLKDYILASLVRKPKKAKNKRSSGSGSKKCRPANKVGPDAILMLGEGDSAMTTLSIAITNCSHLGNKNVGLMSTGGVIINVRKNVTVHLTAGARVITMSPKLKKNEFFKDLVAEIGLDLNAEYDAASPTYEAEIKRLRYGQGIIAAVDQDLDGKGNIFSLILNMFDVFWPHLIVNGFIKRFETPIVRARPKKRGGPTAMTFYSMIEYEKWARATNTTPYDIRYYKGLASHSKRECPKLCENFHEHLITYKPDERTDSAFCIYFEKETQPRKIILSQPVPVLADELAMEQVRTHIVTCSDHLRYEFDPFCRTNLKRKLFGVYDGFNTSARKIFDGSRKHFRKSPGLELIDRLAASIARSESYHQGVTSLYSSIAKKTQDMPGGVQLPILLSESSCGSRLGGGKDVGQPRYTYVSYNKRINEILYPEADYYMLTFNFEDGKRAEPLYFIPILPTAVLESMHMPSHGWKIQIWGRDVMRVIDIVRKMVQISDSIQFAEPTLNTYRWGGDLRNVRGKMWSFGKYTVDERANTITVTELPLRVWTRPYILTVRKDVEGGDIVHSIKDLGSNDKVVLIAFKLQKDAMARILSHEFADSCYADSVEVYLRLGAQIDSHINLMGPRDDLRSFSKYGDVIREWFPERRKFYEMRVDRMRTLLDIEVLWLQNIVRYVRASNDMQFSTRRRADMVARLEADRYDRVWESLLRAPKFTQNADLAHAITKSDNADYSYLLKLSDDAKSAESLEQFEARLAKKQEERNVFAAQASGGRFPGALMWLEELNELERRVIEGRRTDWLYENFGRDD